MKIEVGKKYKTRDGREVLVFRKTHDCIEGRIKIERGFTEMDWDIDGESIGEERDSNLDLISEVKNEN